MSPTVIGGPRTGREAPEVVTRDVAGMETCWVLQVFFFGTAPVEPVGETAVALLVGAGPLALRLLKLAGGSGAAGLATWREAALWRAALSGTVEGLSGEAPRAEGTRMPAAAMSKRACRASWLYGLQSGQGLLTSAAGGKRASAACPIPIQTMQTGCGSSLAT